jgi:hypothetical protein
MGSNMGSSMGSDMGSNMGSDNWSFSPGHVFMMHDVVMVSRHQLYCSECRYKSLKHMQLYCSEYRYKSLKHMHKLVESITPSGLFEFEFEFEFAVEA